MTRIVVPSVKISLKKIEIGIRNDTEQILNYVKFRSFEHQAYIIEIKKG